MGEEVTSWQRYRAKPPRERRAAMWALAMTPLIKPLLRFGGYRRTVAFLEAVGRSPSAGDPQPIVSVASAAMDRLPFRTTCLDRSLVSWWLLGGEDHARIKFGVAFDETIGKPRFHAWVEADGRSLDLGNEHDLTFVPLEAAETIQPDRFD